MRLPVGLAHVWINQIRWSYALRDAKAGRGHTHTPFDTEALTTPSGDVVVMTCTGCESLLFRRVKP